MPTTRPEKEQATESIQSDEYQPTGRQEAPTNHDALYGGNADDNSGSGGNAATANRDSKQEVLNDKGDEHTGSISGPGVSGGSASGDAGTSIGQVTL